MDSKPANLYTVEGLAWLTAELAREQAKWDNYSGNNPNKGAADRRALSRQIEQVTAALKDAGTLPSTPEERLKKVLDKQTPGRLKGCCTRYEGQWYKFRLTGKNADDHWTWAWDAVDQDEVNGPGSYIHRNG